MAGRGLNLNNFAESFTENASRLGARIQESISEHTRDLAITRGPNAGYFDAPEDKVRNVRKHLDSNSDREKLDGLKTLIALISRGRNVSEFFPYVVKNVASQNLEIRKLVYIYLLRYAESEPDLALLSINTFQKDLTDSNPLIRAMALRVLSGINVPMVGSIVVLAVKKCAGDPSPYVRKAAALAVIKCYQMDSGHLVSLIPILETLLKDKSALSIGAVADAFQEVCPTRLDLLHKHFRRLCRMVVDVDAWGQVSLLELLARYARSMLSKPSVVQNVEDLDPDLGLLLSCCEPLLMSRNPAVIMAVSRVYYYLGPSSCRQKIVSPLLRLLHLSMEIERVVLSYLTIIISTSRELFIPHYSQFLIKSTDNSHIKKDKLRILLMLISPDNFQTILREFVVYAEDADEQLVTESVKAIGRCARVIPDAAPQCLKALMDFIKHGRDIAISSAVLVLKTLVHSQLQTQSSSSSNNPLRIVSELAGRLDEVKHPAARACIVWLVGQYAAITDGQFEYTGLPGMAMWAPDVLRRIAKTFSTEGSVVKLQAITLAAKLLVLLPDNDTLLVLTRYVFSLGHYDPDYGVRDRARLVSTLLQGVTPNLQKTNGIIDSDDSGALVNKGGVVLRREQVRLVLFDGKQGVPEDIVIEAGSEVIGSLEAITGRSMGLDSSRRLPEWSEGTDSSLRDAEEEYPSIPVTSITGRAIGFGSSNFASPAMRTPTIAPSPQGSFYNRNDNTTTKGVWKDLDTFYANTDGSEEEEVESDDSEEDEDDGDEEMEDMVTLGDKSGSDIKNNEESVVDEYDSEESDSSES